MTEQLDVQTIMIRANEIGKEIRKSEAYPALIGGIAGGIAGALVAVIIASRMTSRRSESVETDRSAQRGWSLRDMVQLMTVLTPIVKQVQAWFKEQGRNRD